MDFSLRCNSLKCRTQLSDRAVVTTCSHIFCVPCSESLGLAAPNGGARTCPACETQLPNPDDAVLTQLNPTEDYKTSVLSGLSPSIIIECAGRGLSFFSYQTTQEIVYQEYLARCLTNKYSDLSSQMDTLVHSANTEIQNLQDKLAAVQLERKNLEQKNHELATRFREKAKKEQTLQKMYQALKQRQLASGMEMAADRDATHVLQATAIGHDRSVGHSRNGSNHSGGSNGRSKTIHAWENQMASRAAFQPSHGSNVPATPSGHRSRLPLYSVNDTTVHENAGTAGGLHHGTPFRPALQSIDPNIYGNSNSAGYGMSAGIKVGRQHSGPINRTGVRAAGGRPSALGGLNIR